jgi:hypothetical protein
MYERRPGAEGLFDLLAGTTSWYAEGAVGVHGEMVNFSETTLAEIAETAPNDPPTQTILRYWINRPLQLFARRQQLAS